MKIDVNLEREVDSIIRKHIDEYMQLNNDDMFLNEADLFFDRNVQLMSPFDPDGSRYSWGGAPAQPEEVNSMKN